MMKIGYEVKFVNSTNDYFVYNTKIIETPTTKEIYFYESPIYSHSNTKSDLTKTSKRKTFDEMSAHKQYDSLKRKQKHYEQTRWEIARILDCNFDNKTKFLTLTFKDNIQDITITNREFKYFIQRLNYYLYQTKIQTLKYIATWEKQKRGVGCGKGCGECTGGFIAEVFAGQHEEESGHHDQPTGQNKTGNIAGNGQACDLFKSGLILKKTQNKGNHAAEGDRKGEKSVFFHSKNPFGW